MKSLHKPLIDKIKLHERAALKYVRMMNRELGQGVPRLENYKITMSVSEFKKTKRKNRRERTLLVHTQHMYSLGNKYSCGHILHRRFLCTDEY